VLLLARTLPYIDMARNSDPIDKELEGPSKALRAKIVEVARKIPVVCASGNSGLKTLAYPASIQETIAVGACNEEGFRSTYSQYGDGLDVVAPSNDVAIDNRNLFREEDTHEKRRADGAPVVGKLSITTTDNIGAFGYNVDPTSDYCLATGNYGFGGTSASAAQVAGVVGLMLSAGLGQAGFDPKKRDTGLDLLKLLPPSDIKMLLRKASSQQHTHRDRHCTTQDALTGEFGAGLIDASKAVRLAFEAVKAKLKS
jgi:subtilisin family serine protease